ncbi:MAG: hypothetical protein ABW069_05585 [Duganella sp.]
MRPWLTRTLIVATAFAACWLGAVWYWRDTHRMPGADDLLIYLLLLPLMLLLLVWLAVWTGRKLMAAAVVGATAASADAAPAASPAPGPAAPPPLTVIAAALRLPHGDTAVQLADAILARRTSLELDPELLNDDGYPVLTGRIADVDSATQEEDMTDWLARHHPYASWIDEQWRAIALGSEIAARLALELAAHPALPPYLDAAAAGKPLPPLPMLHVVALLPPEWDAPVRQAAHDWLRQLVVRTGWPDARIAPALAPTLAGTGQHPLPLIGQLARQAGTAEQPLLCLLVACHSRIGQDSVQAWADRFILLDSAHPNGRIPGEGAAGLLLADQAQAALFDREDAPLLHPASNALRANAFDTHPRADVHLLAEMASQALAAAGVAPAAVSVLTSDSDQRAASMTEVMGMASALLPELDPGSQVLNVTAACGDAGVVSTVAALVLAAQQVEAGAGPALCVTNLDPFHRGAVLLTAPV